MTRKKSLTCGIELANLIFSTGMTTVGGKTERIVECDENIWQGSPIQGTLGFLHELKYRGYKLFVIAKREDPALVVIWLNHWKLPIDGVVCASDRAKFHLHVPAGTIRSQSDHVRILNTT